MIMKNLMLWVSLVGKKKPLKNRISSKMGDEAGALIEHFLKGITLVGHWYINQDEKNNK